MDRALFVTAAFALILVTAGSASAQTCYSMPFPDSVITDPWGCGAACGRTRNHRGTDFGRACGTPIIAIASGVVVANETSPCLGNVLAIRHPDGMVSGYSHMGARSPFGIGSAVTRGEVIGAVGQTGDPTSCVFGCHLHLTLGPTDDSWYAGDYTRTVDPVRYIHEHEAGVNCEEGTAVLDRQAATYAAPTSTDVNGDGRADLCARASDGFHCYPATDEGWAESWTPIPWTDAGTWNELNHYATIRMGDVNGDGLADACIRSNEAFHCALSNGEGFDEMTVWREAISDPSWGNRQYFTTIRLADVNADGRDDFCARHSAGFSCWLSDGTTFATRIDGPLWSDSSGFDAPQYYGTLRMGDIDGDGRADVCVRASAYVVCALSTGDGFTEPFPGPEWSSERGFHATRFWSTMRMGDVNGDDLDDLCIRTGVDYRCHFSTGDGFETAATIVGAMPDDSGWADPTNYETIRLGDVNGDGAQDVCARANAELLCWAWNGEAFERFSGPAWSDESSWNSAAYYYDTIRIADQDGDGLADACARASTGFRCHLSTGDAFEELPLDSGLLANAQGWETSPSFWTTIYMAGRCEAEPETCNGRDDDCDGDIDDGTCIDAPPPLDTGATTDRDGGVGVDGGRPRGAVGGSCSCSVGTRSSVPGSFVVIAAALAMGLYRRKITSVPGRPG